MKGIGFKLWAGMMVLVLFMLALLWLFQIVFLERFYTDLKIASVKKQASAIAKLIEENHEAEFEKRAEAFAYENNLNVELIGANGDSIYETGFAGGGQMPMMINREKAAAFERILQNNQEVSFVFEHPRFGNKLMLYGLPIGENRALKYILLVNMSIAPVEDTAAILKQQFAVILGILLVAAVILSYILSKTFSAPILEIIKVTKKMASGDFNDRIKTQSSDEIGELASSINNMGYELSKTEQLRKDLIANVSHELRTPLSLIKGYAETMRDVTGSIPEKREKQLGIIIEESDRLSKIVDDILNLSQMQAGYLRLNKKRFLLSQTAEDIVKRYVLLSEQADVKLEYENSEEIWITADEQRLEQVFYNLINNAFNHTPKGGTVTVKLTSENGKVKAEIKDTGAGIDAEDIAHIWDRYYKADKTSERRAAGTGLGLAIVKGILEAHHAKFGVLSQKGAGTAFWFELEQ